MIRKPALFFILAFFTVAIQAQDWKPQNADIILKSALQQAKAGNKNVMIIFHASWCGWCARLEKVIESPELKNIFNNNWAIARIDVMERKGKIDSLENPGGKALMKKYGGEKAGLPFYVFVDGKGRKITSSLAMPDKSNIGYPGANEEIDIFGKVLKSASKKITDKQIAEIKDYLIKHAPKQNAPQGH
jgi:thioredoxin-related protein